MKRRGRGRRRLAIWAAVATAGIVAGVLLGVVGDVDRAIRELTLPLRHEDVIRQQAREKGVDAALIAAVIDTESKFSDVSSTVATYCLRSPGTAPSAIPTGV